MTLAIDEGTLFSDKNDKEIILTLIYEGFY